MAHKLGKRTVLVLCAVLAVVCLVLVNILAVKKFYAEEAEAHTHGADSDATWKELEGGGELSEGFYYLSGNLSLNENITVSGNVTLCLNGYILKGAGNGAVITILDGANLTLYDCREGDADYSHNYYKVDNGAYVFCDDGCDGHSSHSTFYGGVITGGTGIADDSSVTDPTIRGGGIYMYGGSFNMVGGAIAGNSVGGTFNGTTYDGYGAGVYVGGGTFNMSGGCIFGNLATGEGEGGTGGGSGGGVRVNGDGIFNMSGGCISENTATSSGGGVNVTNGTLNMECGAITGNSARSGAGVYVNSGNYSDISYGTSVGGAFNMSGGTISGNTLIGSSGKNSVQSNGSGVYVYTARAYRGTFSMTGGYLDGTVYNSSSAEGRITISGGYLSETANGSVDDGWLTDGGDTIYIALDISADNHYNDSGYSEAFPYAVYKDGAASLNGINISVTYGESYNPVDVESVAVSYSYTNVNDTSVIGYDLPVNAGSYNVTATFLTEYFDMNTKTYYYETTVTFIVVISKATPAYTAPTLFTVCEGSTLSDIDLSYYNTQDGTWSWKDDVSTSVGEAGEYSFTAIFVPNDTDNYNSIEAEITIIVSAHSGGYSTCISKAVCGVCGKEYGEFGEHSYSSDWCSDNTNHWQVCTTCGTFTDSVSHTWNDGEETGEGNITYTCTVCGKTKTEINSVTEEGGDQPEVDEDGGETDGDQSDVGEDGGETDESTDVTSGNYFIHYVIWACIAGEIVVGAIIVHIVNVGKRRNE